MEKQDDDLLVYDEDAALNFILKHLPADVKITETDIEYVLDVVYDYYDENGLIEEDSAEEANIDEEDMFKFIQKAAKKDKISLTDDEIRWILDGEFEYGKSIGVYEDEI